MSRALFLWLNGALMNKCGAVRLLCVAAVAVALLPLAAAAQVPDAAGVAAVASVLDGGRPTRAELCRYGSGADAVETGVGLDVRAFAAGQVCGPELEDDLLVVAVETSTAWATGALAYFEVFLDVDGDDRNGCGGADLIAATVPTEDGGLAATLYEARGCDSATWTFRGEAAASRGGTGDTIGIAIERVLLAGTSGTVRFYTVLRAAGAARSDIAPPAGWGTFRLLAETTGSGGTEQPETEEIVEEDEPPRTCFEDRFGDALDQDGEVLAEGDIVAYCALLTDDALDLWTRPNVFTDLQSLDEDDPEFVLQWELDVGVPPDLADGDDPVLDGVVDYVVTYERRLQTEDEVEPGQEPAYVLYSRVFPPEPGCAEEHLADVGNGEWHVRIPAACIRGASELFFRTDLDMAVAEEGGEGEADVVRSSVDGAPGGYRDDVLAGPILRRRSVSPPPTPRGLPASGLFDSLDPSTERVALRDPTTFAQRVSRARFLGWEDADREEPDGSTTTRRAAYAVLARDDVFADALAAAPLLADGPLLLVQRSQVSDQTLAELHRLLPIGGTVYVLGGEAAVGRGVEERLLVEGFDVVRVGGPDRIDTSLLIADLVVARGLGDPGRVVLARAFGAPADPTSTWADAVSAGAWAASEGVPVLLTGTAALDPRVASALEAFGTQETILVGGAEALAPEVEAAAPGARRVAGPTRAATAVAVAEQLWPTSARDRAIIANAYVPSGWAFALAVAGGTGPDPDDAAPILYADRAHAPEETLAYLTAGCDDPTDLLILGDTGLIGAGVARLLEEADDPGDPACPA